MSAEGIHVALHGGLLMYAAHPSQWKTAEGLFSAHEMIYAVDIIHGADLVVDVHDAHIAR